MTPALTLWQTALLSLYYLCLSLLACLGVHRVWLILAVRRIVKKRPAAEPEQWPPVLVQLPLYNEPAVAERLIRACAAFDYPTDRLEIQVLDDSTDETTRKVRACLATINGVTVSHVRRSSRVSFKAGALAEGLRQSTAPLVAIFDADFVPPPGFLKRTVAALLEEDHAGFVQVPWGHLNRSGPLARAQGVLLDGHFQREHRVRAARGLIFNFNGTAGVWRREAIEGGGGWQGDTLTEDFDLSYRARFAGWKGIFLSDLSAPAELPTSWNALRSQQARWARGSIQCAKKLLRPLWQSDLPLSVRAEGTIPLLANLAWPLLVLLMVLSFPLFLIRQEYGLYPLFWIDLALLLPATLAFFVFYVGLPAMERTPATRMIDAGLALLLGIALAVNNARAALLGLFGGQSAFVRTPKTGGVRNAPATKRKSTLRPIEAALAAYLILLLILEIQMGVWVAVPFTALFAGGTLWGTLGT